jgi:parallel beta-helix repeat protein
MASVVTAELLVDNMGMHKRLFWITAGTNGASSRPSIYIDGDSDFTTTGAAKGCGCVRSGSGSEGDPYVISGWVLNASKGDGISVFGTNAYFVITAVTVYGNSTNVGIVLNNVGNVTVKNSLIKDNFVGVYAVDTTNLTFDNNTVENNEYGIRLEASNGNLLSTNEFVENELAIFLRGSDSVIRDNRVARSGFGAINIDGTMGAADGNLIEANLVTNSNGYGIGMWEASNCVVKGNNVTRNGVGIMLVDGSQNNTITSNIVTHSEGNGIAIGGNSSHNVVRGNIALGNGDGFHTFDLLDSALNNIWQNNTYVTKKPNTLD